ncbi:uncharacterized protein LOC112694281 [Sipha flava]|uniref:Uncharacterized protein LOC112694281 n=1 Tax=Sipha flava TaxID=143950 RepID=A0A8B8GR19_9HEMI|nr:uncharacterized protein LOC112694281 [Sipha flava]
MWSLSVVFNNFVFYEYIALVTCVRIMVRKINDELSKGSVSIGELGTLHTVVLDGLEHMNRFVLGLPMIVNIIANNMSSVIYLLYHYVIFKGLFIASEVNLFVPVLDVALKLFDTVLLFWFCRAVEIEVNRTTLVLQQKLIMETDQKVRRKLAFFSLRRLHADFNFMLCGIYKINYRQLLSLLSKMRFFDQ